MASIAEQLGIIDAQIRAMEADIEIREMAIREIRKRRAQLVAKRTKLYRTQQVSNDHRSPDHL
jgi:hypothetical protein